MIPVIGHPSISVIVFVRNAVGTLSRALASVTGPDQPPVELLVLDGGSTDGTVEVIRTFENKIAFWSSHLDGGGVYALNEGVRRASGDIIVLLPADDWFETGALHIVREAFASRPDLEVLSCGVRIVHFDKKGLMHEDAVFSNEEALAFTLKKIIETPLTAARIVKRRLYLAAGSWNPEYQITSDLDFLIKIYFMRPITAVSSKLVYTYERHAGSQTLSGNPLTVIRMMEGNILMVKRFLQHELSVSERRVLIASHGRWSARLAWMQIMRCELRMSVRILLSAIRTNWLWPVQVWWWLWARIIFPAEHL